MACVFLDRPAGSVAKSGDDDRNIFYKLFEARGSSAEAFDELRMQSGGNEGVKFAFGPWDSGGQKFLRKMTRGARDVRRRERLRCRRRGRARRCRASGCGAAIRRGA